MAQSFVGPNIRQRFGIFAVTGQSGSWEDSAAGGLGMEVPLTGSSHAFLNTKFGQDTSVGLIGIAYGAGRQDTRDYLGRGVAAGM